MWNILVMKGNQLSSKGELNMMSITMMTQESIYANNPSLSRHIAPLNKENDVDEVHVT